VIVASALLIQLTLPQTAAQQQPAATARPYVDVHGIRLSVDPANYNIAYIIGEDFDELDDAMTAPDGWVPKITKADVFTSWDALIEADAEETIEALIVHPSAYESADLEWTAMAARRGLVMVVLDMYTAESAALRGSACSAATASKYPDNFKADREKGYYDDYYLVMTFVIVAKDRSQQAAAETAAFDECTARPPAFTYGQSSQGMISLAEEERDYYLPQLASVIMIHIDGVRDMHFKAANLDLRPTQLPTMPPEFLTLTPEA
jgi:hypothetical protein